MTQPLSPARNNDSTLTLPAYVFCQTTVPLGASLTRPSLEPEPGKTPAPKSTLPLNLNAMIRFPAASMANARLPKDPAMDCTVVAPPPQGDLEIARAPPVESQTTSPDGPYATRDVMPAGALAVISLGYPVLLRTNTGPYWGMPLPKSVPSANESHDVAVCIVSPSALPTISDEYPSPQFPMHFCNPVFWYHRVAELRPDLTMYSQNVLSQFMYIPFHLDKEQYPFVEK